MMQLQASPPDRRIPGPANGAVDGPGPEQLEIWERRFPYYSRLLRRLFAAHVPPGAAVLEVGCYLGDLLASLSPARGVGIAGRADVAAAHRRHPHLRFVHADPVAFDLGGETFDYVVVSTVLGTIGDVQGVFESLRAACRPETRILVAYHNALWEPLLRLATVLKLRRSTGEQNWLSLQDLTNLLQLADFDLVRTSTEVLLPFHVPVLSPVVNRGLVRFWPFTHMGLIQFLIARPGGRAVVSASPAVSVVVPTRNERGNIAGVVERVPEMGAGTEIVFVDGSSTDGTVDEIRRQMQANPRRNIKLILQGDGRGKGDAVRKGFAAASGEVLMILDADLAVPPEVLPRFLDALLRGKGEFVNGTRLVYPMEKQAMPFLNKLGNRFFSALFTWLLGQPVRDTLCGTKVLTRRAYEVIVAGREYFGKLDPFGDFDLLLGAARAGLKIVEIPVCYRARRYGATNIRRFRHGWQLLRMSWVAFCRLKLRG